MKPISLVFPFPSKITKGKKSKKRKMIKIHNDYTPMEIQLMDDPQLEYLYEHGSPAEREIAGEIIKRRKNWDIIMNKSLDDPLPNGSGQQGAPTAGGR